MMSDIETQADSELDEEDEAIVESEEQDPDVESVFQYVFFGRYYAEFSKQLWCVLPIMTTEFGGGLMDVSGTLYENYVNFILPREKIFPFYEVLSKCTIFIGVVLGFIGIIQFGRQNTLMFVNELYFLGCLIATLSPSIYAYSFTTMLCSSATYATFMINPIYISEIVNADLRGFFFACSSLSYQLGVIMGSGFIYYYIPEQMWVGVWTVCPIISLLLTNFVPESPVWLLQTDRPQLAKKHYFWLNEYTAENEEEFRYLTSILEKSRRSTIRDAFSKPYIKPIIIMLNLHMLRMSLFMLQHNVQEVHINALGVYFFFDLVLRVCVLLAVVVSIHTLTRRCLFLTSSTLTYSIFLLRLIPDVHFTLGEWSNENLFFLIAYRISTHIGIIHIPEFLWCEYFPMAFREIGGAIVSVFFLYTEFYVEYFVPNDVIDSHWFPWLCWTLGASCTIISYFIMPNTDGVPIARVNETLTNSSWMLIPTNVRREPDKLSKAKTDDKRSHADKDGRKYDDRNKSESVTEEDISIDENSEEVSVEEEDSEDHRPDNVTAVP